jgi:hypothetical protein
MLLTRLTLTIGAFAALVGCSTGPQRHAFSIDELIHNEDGSVTLKAEGLSKYLPRRLPTRHRSAPIPLTQRPVKQEAQWARQSRQSL